MYGRKTMTYFYAYSTGVLSQFKQWYKLWTSFKEPTTFDLWSHLHLSIKFKPALRLFKNAKSLPTPTHARGWNTVILTDNENPKRHGYCHTQKKCHYHKISHNIILRKRIPFSKPQIRTNQEQISPCEHSSNMIQQLLHQIQPNIVNQII